MKAPKSARIMCVAMASVLKIEIGETGDIMNEAPTTIPAYAFGRSTVRALSVCFAYHDLHHDLHHRDSPTRVDVR